MSKKLFILKLILSHVDEIIFLDSIKTTGMEIEHHDSYLSTVEIELFIPVLVRQDMSWKSTC